MDESGLYWRLLPRRTYILGDENRRMLRGSKNMQSKDRVTVMLCVNASGTHKLPPTFVGKAENPRCFRSANVTAPYFSQKSAWCDERVFRQWWQCVFKPHICKHHPGQKVSPTAVPPSPTPIVIVIVIVWSSLVSGCQPPSH